MCILNLKLNYLSLNNILTFLTKIKNFYTFKIKFKLNLLLNCYHISHDANNLIIMITIYSSNGLTTKLIENMINLVIINLYQCNYNDLIKSPLPAGRLWESNPHLRLHV